MAHEHEHHEHSGDHAGHGHEDELFPRLAVSELVGDAEGGRRTRERWQTWLLGLTLALLALGLPQPGLLPPYEGLVVATAERVESPFFLGAHLARFVATLSGLMVERSWYFISALTYGLAFPLLVGVLRSIGFTHAASMFAGGVALAAPVAWVGGTLPSAHGLSLIGAVALARALFLRSGPPWRYSAVASLAWVGATLMNPENGLLWPVVAFAVWSSIRQHPNARWADWLSALGPVAALASILATVPELVPDNVGMELGTGTLFIGGVYLWCLGAAAAGLAPLFVSRRLPEESPPPGWLRVWALLAVGPFLTDVFWRWGAAGTLVLPAAAIGVADWLDRRSREQLTVLWGARLLAFQVLLAVAAMAGYATISEGPWRTVAREHLEPTDHVITRYETNHYLLRYRWGLEAVLEPGPDEDPSQLVEFLEAAKEGDARIVLDRADLGSSVQSPPEALRSSGIEYWVLQAYGGMVAPDVLWDSER
jgi:hypothetical protein